MTFRTEFNLETGGVLQIPLTSEEIAAVQTYLNSAEYQATAQRNINIESREYLASTDWYVTRFLETGTSIPDDVTLKRQQARESIV